MKPLFFFVLSLAIVAQADDEIGLGTVMRHLAPGGDWIVSDAHDGRGSQLTRWNEQTLGPRPTPAQIESARATIAATEALRASLRAEFAALSPGEQALYRTAFDGVKAMLDLGNFSEAKKVIFLSPVATDELAAARLRMLALFPEE